MLLNNKFQMSMYEFNLVLNSAFFDIQFVVSTNYIITSDINNNHYFMLSQ